MKENVGKKKRIYLPKYIQAADIEPEPLHKLNTEVYGRVNALIR